MGGGYLKITDKYEYVYFMGQNYPGFWKASLNVSILGFCGLGSVLNLSFSKNI